MRKSLLLTIFIALTTTLLAQVEGFEQKGKASFYADKFEGRTTASGERYSHKKATCAHLTLPFGTLVKVTNLMNNKTAVVRVNDRGPFVADRIIDLSKSVAERLDFVDAGVTDVLIETISNEGEQQLGEATATISNNPENTTNGELKPKGKPNKKEVVPTETKKLAAETQTIDESELFSIDVEKVESEGYSVQIASYKELVSVLRVAADVEKALGKKVRIQVTSLNGERIYRIMVGEFSSSKDARNFKEKAAKVYNDCFVVNLNKTEKSN